MKKETLKLTGAWADAFGEPERIGVWFIWGNSGNGKSSFVMQLCKELAKFGRVAYDSLEEGASHTQMSYKEYIKFKEAHRNKLLIFISHADGRNPDGRSAKKVMYDAALKIYVEGFRAFSKGRFFGSVGHFTIWDEGAVRYWGDNA